MLVREGLLREVGRLIVWYPLRWVMRLLPVVWAFGLLRVFGDLHFFFSRGKRNSVETNLRKVFSRKEDGWYRENVRYYLRNHYINQLQIFIFPKLNKINFLRCHSFAGLEHLDEGLRHRKGCILVHPHFGPTQLPLHHLGVLGYRMMQIGYPTADGLSYIGRNVAFRLRLKYEGKIKARIVPANVFLREVFNYLKNNNVIMTSGDGAGGGSYIGKFMAVEVAGMELPFSLGAFSLAKRTGATILPTFTVLEGNACKTIIGEPLDTAGSINELCLRFARLFEAHIIERPYLWHFWDELDSRVACARKIA